MAEVVHGIETDPDRRGGEPTVAGTRVPVRLIGHLVERTGASPADAADRYDLSLPDVHRALAYYYDNPDEMERWDRRDDELEARSLEADAETVDEVIDRVG